MKNVGLGAVNVDDRPEGRQLWPDGEPMVVVRPLDVQMTVALAKVALTNDSADALREAVSGPCQVVGFLFKTSEGRLMAVDENDENAEHVQVGDIIVSPQELQSPE